MIKSFLPLGKIVGTHGVRGEVKVAPWCDGPDFAKQFKTVYFSSNGDDPIAVVSVRSHKNQILMLLEGVGSIDEAETLRNRVLYFKRSDGDLSPGTWFIEELIGCDAFDADDPAKRYGRLTDVLKTGANDVWQITDDGGKDYLLPAIRDVAVGADVASGKVFIRPLKGIFNDAD